MESKDLIKFFESKEFLEALKIAGSTTFRTGHETSFKGYIANDKVGIYDIIAGGCDSVSAYGSAVIKKNINHLKLKYADTNVEDILHLHFHPGYDEPIIPSQGDLFAILCYYDPYSDKKFVGVCSVADYDVDRYNDPNLDGIAQIDNGRNIEILLLKQLRPVALSPNKGNIGDAAWKFAENLSYDCGDKETTEDIAEHLKTTGFYHADVLHVKGGVIQDLRQKIIPFSSQARLIAVS